MRKYIKLMIRYNNAFKRKVIRRFLYTKIWPELFTTFKESSVRNVKVNYLKKEWNISYYSMFNKDAFLIGSKGILFTGGKINSKSLITHNYKGSRELISLGITKKIKRKGNLDYNKKEEIVLLPGLGWHNNFYHWLIEVLPTIVFFFEILDKQEYKNIKLALPNRLNSFQVSSLKLLNISEKYIVSMEDTDILKVSSVIVVKDVRRYVKGFGYSIPDSYLLNVLQNRVLSNLLINIRPYVDIVWVSRVKTGDRFIVNEDNIISTIRNNGYTIRKLIPEDHTFEDQVSIIKNTQVVIGSHGAGLSNIIWSDCHTLIEIVANIYINPSFKSICSSTNRNYQYLIGEPSSVKAKNPRSRKKFHVESEKVLNSISKAVHKELRNNKEHS